MCPRPPNTRFLRPPVTWARGHPRTVCAGRLYSSRAPPPRSCPGPAGELGTGAGPSGTAPSDSASVREEVTAKAPTSWEEANAVERGVGLLEYQLPPKPAGRGPRVPVPGAESRVLWLPSTTHLCTSVSTARRPQTHRGGLCRERSQRCPGPSSFATWRNSTGFVREVPSSKP